MKIKLNILKEEKQSHVVKSGDTMWRISRKYKVNLDNLIAANPQVKNIRLIYPGDIINIPSKDETGGSTGKQKNSPVISMEPMKIVGSPFEDSEDRDFKNRVDELTGHIIATKALASFQSIRRVDDPGAKIVPIGANRYQKAVEKAISIAKELRLKVDQDLISDENKKYFFASVAKANALTREGIYPKISTSGSAIEIYLSIKPNTMIVGIPWSSLQMPVQGKISREEFEKMYENLLLVKDLYQNGQLGNFKDDPFFPRSNQPAAVAPSAPLPR